MMADFDPDAYLADSASSSAPHFDPDAYLAQPKSSVADFFQSIPRGLLSGLAGTASATGQAAQIEMGQPVTAPSRDEATNLLEEHVTGALPQPQGMAGRFGSSIGEAVGSPASYVGPGGLPLKVAGAILGGAGGQAGEETGLPGGRFVGALAGGASAAKAIGPKQAVAAIPTQSELVSSAKAGYKTALDSGLELHPSAVKNFGTAAEQELINQGYAPELAGKTFSLLNNIQKPPAGSSVTAGNLDTMRKYLGRVAQETQPANGGMVKATPDAAAASVVLERLKNFTENPPARSVVAGDPEAYASAIKQANADYAASQRLGNFDTRISKAENVSDRQVSGSIANQIRAKVGSTLDNPKAMRGLTDAEKAQINLINSGNLPSNIMRQLGRGGAPHVIPIAMQMGAAAKTGGATLPIWATMVASRLGDNALTKARAQTLLDMLAKRSPLYQSRADALSTTSMLPNQAQLLRSGLLGLR